MMDEKKLVNPVKAIRAKCLDCCCDQKKEVELCQNTKCALHPFRFGKNPYRAKRELTEEQRTAMSERMRAIQAAQQEKRNQGG